MCSRKPMMRAWTVLVDKAWSAKILFRFTEIGGSAVSDCEKLSTHTHIYIYIYVKIHEVENSDWLTNYPKYEWILAIGYKSFSTPFKSKTSSRRYWNILGIYLSNFMCIYYMCPHMYVQYKSVYMHMYIMHTHAELHITPNHSWDTCDHFLVAETAAKWRAPCKPQRHIKHCNLGKRGVISKWS